MMKTVAAIILVVLVASVKLGKPLVRFIRNDKTMDGGNNA